jgi:hypothetical protein
LLTKSDKSGSILLCSTTFFIGGKTMTWLDLYNLLHKKANDIHNLDSALWSSQVTVHDAPTGSEYSDCNVLNLEGKTVLAYNYNNFDEKEN